MKELICLGIESTAHTIGFGLITNKGKILSEAKSSYTTEKEGMIPIDVAKHHEKNREILLKKALEEAKLTIKDIDIIAISQGPGLAPSLLVGMKFAKELAIKNNKPLIGVNHLCAHLEIGKLFCSVKDPIYVFVSGANTQIIAKEKLRYKIFGETLDIALGNALDKTGRIMNLGFPAGPKIEELAKKGKYIDLPYVVKGMDLSYAGIVTNAQNKFKQEVSKEDICFSIQETMFSMLVEVTERALAYCDKKEVLLVGGVAANKRLIEMLEIMCKERNAKSYYVPLKYSGDNPIMIGWLGLQQYINFGVIEKAEEMDIKPGWRTDEVDIN